MFLSIWLSLERLTGCWHFHIEKELALELSRLGHKRMETFLVLERTSISKVEGWHELDLKAHKIWVRLFFMVWILTCKTYSLGAFLQDVKKSGMSHLKYNFVEWCSYTIKLNKTSHIISHTIPESSDYANWEVLNVLIQRNNWPAARRKTAKFHIIARHVVLA